MKDFYNNYEGVSYAQMAVEVEAACNCINSNPCSNLASEVDGISTSMESISAQCQSLWQDSVETNFSEYVTSITGVLKEISSSISSSFTKAEGIYKNLKKLLEQLKNKNNTYRTTYQSKPPEEMEVKSSIEGEPSSWVANPAYGVWKNQVASLETECKGIITQIKKANNDLMAINGERIAGAVTAGGVGGITIPSFEMPEMANSTSETSDTSDANLSLNLNTSTQTGSNIFETDGSYEGNCNVVKNYLKSQGLTDAGVAGLMGNLYSESNIMPNNMQDSYEGKYHDNSYTTAIDNGDYSRNSFVNDSVGYGLAQWTYPSRKAKFYDYCKQKGTSISDIGSQLEYLVSELKSDYPSVWKTLCNSNDLKECTKTVLYKFESPKVKNLSTRLKYANKFI